MKSLVVAFAFLVVSGPGSARELSFREAIDLAREHSDRLKQQQEVVNASDAAAAAARAARWPELALIASARVVDDVPTAEFGLPGGPFIVSELGSTESWLGDIGLSLPLFTGGRLSSAIDAADAVAAYETALAAASDRDVVFATRVRYLERWRADQQVRAAEAAVRRAGLIRDDVDRMAAAGVADSVMVVEAALTLLNAEIALDQARSAVAITNIELRILLGLESTTELILTDTIFADTRRADASPRPELTAAGFLIDRVAAEAKIERSNWWPSLSLSAGYSFGDPNRDQFNRDFDDYLYAGLSVAWSFNVGGQVSRTVAAAEARRRAATYSRDALAESFDREVRVARQRLELAETVERNARNRLDLTERSFALAQAQFDAGTITSTRLLEIEATVTAAAAEFATARADRQLARTRYLFALGSPQLEESL